MCISLNKKIKVDGKQYEGYISLHVDGHFTIEYEVLIEGKPHLIRAIPLQKKEIEKNLSIVIIDKVSFFCEEVSCNELE